MRYKYEDYKHLIRLVLLFILILAGFLVVRKLLIPHSFGEFGHYRGDSVMENMSFTKNIEFEHTITTLLKQ